MSFLPGSQVQVTCVADGAIKADITFTKSDDTVYSNDGVIVTDTPVSYHIETTGTLCI